MFGNQSPTSISSAVSTLKRQQSKCKQWLIHWQLHVHNFFCSFNVNFICFFLKGRSVITFIFFCSWHNKIKVWSLITPCQTSVQERSETGTYYRSLNDICLHIAFDSYSEFVMLLQYLQNSTVVMKWWCHGLFFGIKVLVTCYKRNRTQTKWNQTGYLHSGN